MKLEEKLNKGLKRGYRAKILASDIDLKVTEKLESSRPEVQLKGFRKGQAPIALLKKMYGKQMFGEAMQETIDELVRAHFETSGHKPAQQPDVQMINETYKDGDDIEVSLNCARAFCTDPRHEHRSVCPRDEARLRAGKHVAMTKG